MDYRRSNRFLSPFALLMVLSGFLLPLFMRIGMEVVLRPRNIGAFFTNLPSLILTSGHELLLISAFNAVPYVLLGLAFLFCIWRGKGEPVSVWKTNLLAMRISAGCLLALNVLCQAATWADVLGETPSSTGSIGFIMGPAICLMTLPLFLTIRLLARPLWGEARR